MSVTEVINEDKSGITNLLCLRYDTQLERVVVAVAEYRLGVLLDYVVIEVREQILRSVSAAGTKNGFDFRILIKIHNVGYPIFNRASHITPIIKNMLTENFNVDKESFTKDDKLNNAIDSILDEMVFNQPDNQFTGEYESLKTSEYLFLLNFS